MSSQQPETDGRPAATNGQVAQRQAVNVQISNEMVRLYKQLFGRGPTQARTSFAGPDTIIVTLEDSLTPAERTLADMGEHQRLRDVRLFFQHARAADFREVIEQATGRRVRAFVSGIDTANDVSAEVFYLESTAERGGSDGAPRT
jgi:uncharacterized protein YbcI